MKLLFKWLSRIIVCIVILFILIGVIAYLINKAAEPPSIEEAPWAIQTYSNDELRIPSRIYYATDVEIPEDGVPVIDNYWSFDGKRFKKQKGEKKFPVEIYGNVGITRREQ